MARPVHRRVWPKPPRGPVDPLRNRHAGQTATVVGKGPSLLTLTPRDFGSGPVIAINHAILEVRKLGLANPLYSQQKDTCMVPPCPPETLILSAAQSSKCFASYTPRHVIDVRKVFGITPKAMSTTMAVALARWMGCTAVRMLACDAVTTGDLRSVLNGEALPNSGYGYRYAGDQATKYAARMRMPLEWVAP